MRGYRDRSWQWERHGWGIQRRTDTFSRWGPTPLARKATLQFHNFVRASEASVQIFYAFDENGGENVQKFHILALPKYEKIRAPLCQNMRILKGEGWERKGLLLIKIFAFWNTYQCMGNLSLHVMTKDCMRLILSNAVKMQVGDAVYGMLCWGIL